MRRLSYIVALLLCSASVTVHLVITALAFLRIDFGYLPFVSVLSLFASPISAPLVGVVPRVLQLLIASAFACLLYRRLLLLFRAKVSQPPNSLAVWPGRLLSVAVVFLVLGVVVLGLSIALQAGSGVPAGMLVFPAFLLLSPVMFYVELRSLPWFRVPSSAPEAASKT